MLTYLTSHPNDFEQLIELAISDKQPYSWRAAWLLSNCVGKNDKRVEDYVPEIISRITKAHDSQKRDLINVLRRIEIGEDYRGLVFEICISIWSRLNKIPSVRWSALRLALKITEKHPELYDEILLMTDEYYMESLSNGIKITARKTIEALGEKLNT